MDVRTQPLIAQQGNIRVDPYAQPSSDPNALPPSVAKSAGIGKANTPSPAQQPDANQDGELDAEELGHLQDAAANGDKESWDFLNALKLPLGIAAGAAALYGATRGGLALTDAVMKAKGMQAPMSGRGTPGSNVAPEQLRLTGPSNGLPNPGNVDQRLLPAPATGPVSGQAPAVEPRLEDLRSPYTKSGGKLPTGAAGSDALKAAAQALRRMH